MMQPLFDFPLSFCSLFFSCCAFLISLTNSWKQSSMLTRSLADVSKKGHFRDLARMSPSPYDTSRLSAMSDCVGGGEGGREGGREMKRRKGGGGERGNFVVAKPHTIMQKKSR